MLAHQDAWRHASNVPLSESVTGAEDPMQPKMLTRKVLAALSLFLAACANPGSVAGSQAPRSALDELLAGNQRFVAGQSQHPHQDAARRAETAQGQHPFAVIVGCADSRVPPELVFDCGLGDLFVVRVAGDVCEDAALGSIEYAVEHLGTRTIVVLGHERCGAVDATLKGGELPGHMRAFAAAIAPNVRASGEHAGGEGDKLDEAVRANARAIAHQIATCAPILAEFAHKGELKVIAARYDLDTGKVEVLDSAQQGH
jgi:carbonic anhydrase